MIHLGSASEICQRFPSVRCQVSVADKTDSWMKKKGFLSGSNDSRTPFVCLSTLNLS